jgi:hypothetical protein
MDTTYYLDKFQKYVDGFDKRSFNRHQLQLKVGEWRDSAVLKIQKPSWVNPSQLPLAFNQSIFFSIWMSDASIRESKLCYNIHALKLRQLVNYSIQSREFAQAFRTQFKPFEKDWPNVSLNFGPLTLMEGWVKIDMENFEAELSSLAHQFLTIEFIIDELLQQRNKEIKTRYRNRIS